jgi:phospholipid transport system substrate-binding protein
MRQGPLEYRTGCGRTTLRRRWWGAAVVTMAAAILAGSPPALAADPVEERPPSVIAGGERPLEVVKASVSQVLVAVRSASVAGRRTGERRAEIRRVADGLFDFNEMARLTLARHWAGQVRRGQEEFVRLFRELLERSYLSTIENYAGERIVFQGESISGGYAQVRSRITTERRMEISIDYRLLRRDDRWKVYDVVLDGVSLVANYRSQFNSIMRTSSFEDLLTRLRNKEIQAHVIPRVGRGS